MRDILRVVLSRDGWDADTADDGEEAIKKLSSSTYTVVVLDLMMPRVDGAGVISFIREKAIATTVIVVSAVAHMQPLDPRVVSVTMQKPFEIGDLRAVVSAIADAAGRPGVE